LVKKSRKEKEIAARKMDIINTAVRLFSEKDFHEVTVDEIAKEVGLSKGTLYLYFENKENLFFTTIQERTKQLFALIRETVSTQESFITRLRKLISSYLNFFQEHDHFFRIVHSEKGRFDVTTKCSLHRHLVESYLEILKILGSFIEEGKKEKALRDNPTSSLVIFLLGLLDGMIFHWIFVESGKNLAGEGEKIVDLFLRGTGAVTYKGRSIHE
jgi:AcrR family transcriptional regulator